MKRKTPATFCFLIAGLVVAYIYYNCPLDIKEVGGFTCLWIHFQVHDTQYLFAMVWIFAGLLLLGWPKNDKSISVDFEIPLNKPVPKRFVQGEIIEGFLEIFYQGRWIRVHKHQLNDWLSDEQIVAMKKLEEWREKQDPITKAEIKFANETYHSRRDQIVETRLARMKE